MSTGSSFLWPLVTESATAPLRASFRIIQALQCPAAGGMLGRRRARRHGDRLQARRACQVRDAANKTMREDPRMKNLDMPFDTQRIIFGGFESIFDTAGNQA